jgi:hypothetical protein
LTSFSYQISSGCCLLQLLTMLRTALALSPRRLTSSLRPARVLDVSRPWSSSEASSLSYTEHPPASSAQRVSCRLDSRGVVAIDGKDAFHFMQVGSGGNPISQLVRRTQKGSVPLRSCFHGCAKHTSKQRAGLLLASWDLLGAERLVQASSAISARSGHGHA